MQLLLFYYRYEIESFATMLTGTTIEEEIFFKLQPQPFFFIGGFID